MKDASILVFALAVSAAALALGPVAAAGTKPYENTRCGFRVRVPDTFKGIPPKLGKGERFLAAEWFDDQQKYKSTGSVNPEFRVTWWVTAKDAVTPSGPFGGSDDGAGNDAAPEEDEPSRWNSFDEYVDEFCSFNSRLFGAWEPLADVWPTAKRGKCGKGKIEFQYVEHNYEKPKKKGESRSPWFVFAARCTLERPGETVQVGFLGTGDVQSVKDLGSAYLAIVKSFEPIDFTDSRNRGVAAEAPDETDPAFRDYVKKNKVIEGWKVIDTKNYILLYDAEANEKLVREIGAQIEAIRAQVYEHVFPPDKPLEALSVVRVCKSREQYMAYGGSPASAGYWSSWGKELVFFEDTSNPKDAIRVLYHEAFHQYIYYSVGDFSPHSWFNEGHGDYFYGHNYKNGRFELGESLARRDTAKALKRKGGLRPLSEWLRWTQREYYGSNEAKLSGLDNYALGWDFVFFLRTHKDSRYRQTLDTYFNTLKGFVTAEAAEREAARAKAKADAEAAGETWDESSWGLEWGQSHGDQEDVRLQKALDKAFEGFDLAQLEKEWLNA